MLLYQLDALSNDMKSIMHRSALSIWKRKDIYRIIGCDSHSVNDISVVKEVAKCKTTIKSR